MSISNIVGRPAPQFKQCGFSITGYLAGIVVAGVITTSMLPSVRDVVDTADYNALSYARSALSSAMQVNHQMSLLRGGNSIIIDGVEVPLRFGYPLANAASLRSFAVFDGFDIEELKQRVRVWSPGRLYCVTYVEASAPIGLNSRPILSRIQVKAEGGCA